MAMLMMAVMVVMMMIRLMLILMKMMMVLVMIKMLLMMVIVLTTFPICLQVAYDEFCNFRVFLSPLYIEIV